MELVTEGMAIGVVDGDGEVAGVGEESTFPLSFRRPPREMEGE